MDIVYDGMEAQCRVAELDCHLFSETRGLYWLDLK